MHPGALSGIALLMLGLGLPQLVDAIEIAHGRPAPQGYGALPWLMVEGIGAILFAHLAWFRRDAGRPVSRLNAPDERAGFIWACLVFVGVLVLPPAVWPQLAGRLEAVSRELYYQALGGLLFVGGAVGLFVFAAFRYAGRHE